MKTEDMTKFIKAMDYITTGTDVPYKLIPHDDVLDVVFTNPETKESFLIHVNDIDSAGFSFSPEYKAVIAYESCFPTKD